MFKFTEIIMKFAPIGVGAAMAYTVSEKGLGVLANLGKLIGTLYVALAFFVVVVLGSVAALFRVPLRDFLAAVRRPATIAFATTSQRVGPAFGDGEHGTPGRPPPGGRVRPADGVQLQPGRDHAVSRDRLDLRGAGGFGKNLSVVATQIVMMLTLMLTSKGVAGVPRASLVILSGTLASFNLPLAGVLVILGVSTRSWTWAGPP